MSILNLNTPQGRGPVGKKSAKIWMGVGLLAAVLGFGSTFAANITLNSPGGQTEFGQGVTQTVFCGGDQSVTVSPVSSYTNTSSIVKIKVVTPNGDNQTVSGSPAPDSQTVLMNSGTKFPKWLTRNSNISGWWLSAANGSRVSSYPSDISTALGLANNASNYFFVPATGKTTYTRGSSPTSYTEYSVQIADDTSNFNLSGVNITNIPSDCKGVNFVVNAYDSIAGNPAITLATGVTSITSTWCNSSSRQEISSSKLSKSRSSYSSISSSVAKAYESEKALELTFLTGTSASNTVSKILVETQEDVLGTPCS